MKAMFTRRPPDPVSPVPVVRPAEFRVQRHWAVTCEIDGFPQYNDIYGRAAGDELIRVVSDTLACGCRSGDSIVRRNGKALAMVIAAESLERAKGCARRHLEAVMDLQIPNQASRFGVVTASMGVAAIAAADSDAIERTLEAADQALARAARCGGNQLATAIGFVTA